MLKAPITTLIERMHNNMSNFFEDDGSVLAHVMLGIKNSTPPKKHKEYSRKDGQVADNRIYVCPKCERGWEHLICSTGAERIKDTILYSTNIVKYKKQRKICKNCLPKVSIEKSKKPPYSGD